MTHFLWFGRPKMVECINVCTDHLYFKLHILLSFVTDLSECRLVESPALTLYLINVIWLVFLSHKHSSTMIFWWYCFLMRNTTAIINLPVLFTIQCFTDFPRFTSRIELYKNVFFLNNWHNRNRNQSDIWFLFYRALIKWTSSNETGTDQQNVKSTKHRRMGIPY